MAPLLQTWGEDSSAPSNFTAYVATTTAGSMTAAFK